MANQPPRDLIGYAGSPPHPRWPNDARLALQFVLNYEEGGENCVLYGDPSAETFLSEIVNAPTIPGRHLSMESIYEYGAWVGVWRILKLFAEQDIPLTIFAVASALQRNPAVVEAFLTAGHEICSHGMRWINYQDVPIDVEREHMAQAIDVIRALTGQRPLGWYTGRTSPNTRQLVIEDGGFVYDADDYSDDLPFWDHRGTSPQLVVPYTLDCNDMRFCIAQGFTTGEHFFQYLKDNFDALYAEGRTAPKMMSVGLHCRIVGRPARLAGLRRFIEYVRSHDKVWLCQRIDIARHWHAEHPAAA